MRVLLLGATGLIGSAVLAQLARDGVEVVAVARTPGMALRHVRWL
ncbi:MAG TPA: NAD-dependent epimerase/dehydratase family protein, partial [Gammaproteobacteria bacterium]